MPDILFDFRRHFPRSSDTVLTKYTINATMGKPMVIVDDATGSGRTACQIDPNQETPLTTTRTWAFVRGEYVCVAFWQKRGQKRHGYNTLKSAKRVAYVGGDRTRRRKTIFPERLGSPKNRWHRPQSRCFVAPSCKRRVIESPRARTTTTNATTLPLSLSIPRRLRHERYQRKDVDLPRRARRRNTSRAL